jgi:hypothetical protein
MHELMGGGSADCCCCDGDECIFIMQRKKEGERERGERVDQVVKRRKTAKGERMRMD